MPTCKTCGGDLRRGSTGSTRESAARCLVCMVDTDLDGWTYPPKPKRTYDAEAARRYRAARKMKLLSLLKGQGS